MKNHKQASVAGLEMIFKYIKSRMKEKKVTQKNLAKILQVSISTLMRYFNQETPMPLGIYMEICGALELRPYLIPKEMDTNQMNRMFFN